MIDTAIILAGGLGTRLRPLTETTPKPLLPIQGKPILEHILNNLHRYGVKKVILSIGYLAEKVQDYFKDGSDWGVKITYLIDGKEPLGTGGAVKLAASGLDKPFFLLWGDNLMDINLNKLFLCNRDNKTSLTMALTPREDVENFGVAKLEGSKIAYFVEKPRREEAPSKLINAGAFVIHPQLLQMLPEGKSSIEKDCFEKIAPQGEISAYIHKGQWFPTDTLEKYNFANEDFDSRSMHADPKLFKTYDVRGEWDSDWNSEFAHAIGRGIAAHLKPKWVAIGRDMRNSSPEIFQQLTSAFCSQGIKVKDLGLCGTELTYFASSFDPEIDVAIMITASHNPGKDNGLKITVKGISIGLDSGLDKIRDAAFQEMTNKKEFRESENLMVETNLWDKYRQHVFKLARWDNQTLPIKKIVIDAGNGIGGYMFDQVLKELPLQVVRLFWEPDGNFPNHPADPFQEKNVEKLKEMVIKEKADLGIAFDGDADRLFLIDETGRYIPGYYLAALLTDFMLKNAESPHMESIAYDPRYHRATKDAAVKHGAKAVPSKVGHTMIKSKMREHNSIFSAECSGHIFYRENNFAESSMLTILLVLKMLSQTKLSQLVDPFFERYPISGEINLKVNDAPNIVEQVKQYYSEGEASHFDGMSVDFPEWRFNVRVGNTEPLLRLNVEASQPEIIREKVEELKKIIGGELINH